MYVCIQFIACTISERVRCPFFDTGCLNSTVDPLVLSAHPNLHLILILILDMPFNCPSYALWLGTWCFVCLSIYTHWQCEGQVTIRGQRVELADTAVQLARRGRAYGKFVKVRMKVCRTSPSSPLALPHPIIGNTWLGIKEPILGDVCICKAYSRHLPHKVRWSGALIIQIEHRDLQRCLLQFWHIGCEPAPVNREVRPLPFLYCILNV